MAGWCYTISTEKVVKSFMDAR
jgi:hypothetical protein